MLKWFLYVLVVSYAVACAGCRECTLIGCQDGAWITVERPNWTMEPLTLNLELDGHSVTCAALVPENSIQQCDDTRVTITYLPMPDCTGCEPNGHYRFMIAIAATPSCINATMRENDVVIGQRTYHPTYNLFYPNGEECDESGCRSWSETWALP